MIKAAIICLLVGCAVASYHPYKEEPRRVKVIKVQKAEKFEKPEPYEFSYDIKDEYHNQQSRQESGDAHGFKTGSYSMQLADGRQRWVEYIADDKGTRMVVRTNEQGTDDQDPADVDLTVDGPLVTKEAPKKILVKAPKYKVVKAPVHRGYY